MNARKSIAQSQKSMPPVGWHVRAAARSGAAPEVLRCEKFSADVRFDRMALSIAAGVDEAWALEGSDPALQMLILQEQTVLEGPNCDVLAAGRLVKVDDVAGETNRWPLLADTRTLPDAPYICLLVVPLEGDSTGPPLGTLCVARDTPTPFSAREVAQVVGLSSILAEMLLDRWRSVRDLNRFQGLVQDQRHLAAGMVASLLGLHPDEALAAMRARAFAEGRTLADFSSEVVAALGVAPPS